MSQKLTLKPGGDKGCTPEPDPWKPLNSTDVEIINESGFEQTLSDITNGCLTRQGQGRVTTIHLGTGSSDKKWTGRAGAIGRNGTYTYDDGTPELAPRIGTIDPS